MLPPDRFGPATFATFGDFLRYLRRRVRKSLRELAQSIGYSEAHMSRIERGERLPPDRTALVTWFVPALELEREPELVARLVELAALARGELLADTSVVLSHTTRQEQTATLETPLPGQPPSAAPRSSPYARLTAGLAGLPGNPFSGVEQFLHEYLGTAQAPAPFGGRAAELAQLDGWLADPSQPLALLVAAAGQGKSALLAQWVSQLAHHHRAAVAFLPVSLRFGTARLSTSMSLLGARLRHLHGVTADPPRDPDVWVREIDAYLRTDRTSDTPLLLVLDGVDEASDWMCGRDLRFPPQLGRGVKVLVSARALVDCDAGGWLRRLEWEGRGTQLALPPLDRRGVEAVVRAWGAPQRRQATALDVSGELYRLSGGDPLLVRLYLEALRSEAGGSSPLEQHELPQVPPGLAAYLERWWEGQHRQWGAATPLREGAVRALLSLLACALGPLSSADLLALTAPEGLDSWTLPAALQPLGRLVVGDGSQQGYVFSHPRLGYYFYEQLTDGERAAWERRLLDYGAQTLHALDTGQVAPQAASRYVVQHYSAHLERAGGAPEQFYALVSQAWLRVWEALDGTYDGFLTDMGRAWRRADAAGAVSAARGQAIGLQCRYALIQASINSFAKLISPSMLAALVEQRIWTPSQGFACACRMQDEGSRAGALAKLAPQLPEPLVREALAVAGSMIEVHLRAWARVHLSLRLAALGYSEEALAFAPEIPIAIYGGWREGEHNLVLNQVAPDLPASLVDAALSAARAIEDKGNRSRALVGLALYLPEDERASVLDEVEGSWHRAWVLIKLMDHLAEAEVEHPAVVAAAQAAVRAIEDSKYQAIDHMLDELVPYLMGVGRPAVAAEALMAAEIAEDAQAQALALAELAAYLPEAAVRAIEDGKYYARARVLAELVPYLAEAERPAVVAEALAAAQMVEGAQRQALALAELAAYLPETVLHAAIATVQTIEDLREREPALSKLAPQLVRFGAMEEAEVLIQTIKSPFETSQARLHLAIWLATSGSPHAALAMIPELGRNSRKLMAHLPEALLPEALAILNAMEIETYEQAQAFEGVALHLPDALLYDVVRLAQAVKKPQFRTRILAELAPRLPAVLLREVLAAVQAIADDYARRPAISALDGDPIWWLVKAAEQEAARGWPGIRWLEAPKLLAAHSIWCRAPELPSARDVAAALAAAHALDDAGQRAISVTQLAARLVDLGEPDAAVAAVQELFQQNHPWGMLAEALELLGEKDYAAEALEHLALYLGQQGYADVALATVQAIDPFAGIWPRILAGLMPHFPEAARRELRTEVLDQLQAKMEVLDQLQAKMKAMGLLIIKEDRREPRTEVLDQLAAEMEERDDNSMAGTYHFYGCTIIPQLAARLVDLGEPDAAVAALQRLPNYVHEDNPRGNTLTHLVLYLGQRGYVDLALVTARAIDTAYWRAEALAGLAPHLSEAARREVLAEALEVARTIEHAVSGSRSSAGGWAASVRMDGSERARALARLAAHLPADERLPVLVEAQATIAGLPRGSESVQAGLAVQMARLGFPQEALELARAVKPARKRAEVLATMLPDLPEADRPDVFAEALESLQGVEYSSRDPCDPHCMLIQNFQQLPRDHWYLLWCRLIRKLAASTRPHLLSFIKELRPVIAELGGQAALAATKEAIVEVGRWFP